MSSLAAALSRVQPLEWAEESADEVPCTRHAGERTTATRFRLKEVNGMRKCQEALCDDAASDNSEDWGSQFSLDTVSDISQSMSTPASSIAMGSLSAFGASLSPDSLPDVSGTYAKSEDE
eukprot:TRINITY_DN7491_c0_g1_i6.p1 TRINITY_DN7491_c0_g1~~TRINITY_DN7491_c0_g1_i6.p1  ORF type:complete len:120 (-),score=14.41 TRINITY_DN7491_c0_g1_i6:448-807(-)